MLQVQPSRNHSPPPVPASARRRPSSPFQDHRTPRGSRLATEDSRRTLLPCRCSTGLGGLAWTAVLLPACVQMSTVYKWQPKRNKRNIAKTKRKIATETEQRKRNGTSLKRIGPPWQRNGTTKLPATSPQRYPISRKRNGTTKRNSETTESYERPKEQANKTDEGAKLRRSRDARWQNGVF